MNYTCWQCHKEFKRKANEWFCNKCIKNREPIEIAKPQFKGGGFYSTGGR